MWSCDDVADYFIKLANDTGSFVSNLQLQKLVYYAQAWHLAIHGEQLFPEDFEAWVHGPVIPELYEQYQAFSWKPIQKEVTKLNLSQSVISFLDEIADVYFCCNSYELERMTQQESPWNIARGNLPIDAPSNSVIQKQWMKEYYANHAQEYYSPQVSNGAMSFAMF
ncbi:Panacea domain-containing protein [Planktothricoides raciborskii]|uniref:DUF4065 domain-containing protein n=1 Tax=Planktothricoides raciborskii FACHB-1370 TaxID=2949576 RepID=A0ABR8E9W4_9CYAN|nr:type II toxin-antitoxin system antitoxin SocA domain-containing protein [Planktothricoides raciborskii]MBD2543187.1 DUF4065 domain-containing protein [Planktothricoides raciborskii FACHB-1370]MBD2580898.1 DUF4065 domain-containing protein [Planktothricoides raciborskii FACHB-1261]